MEPDGEGAARLAGINHIEGHRQPSFLQIAAGAQGNGLGKISRHFYHPMRSASSTAHNTGTPQPRW
jgi:hypothetical protein